MDNNSAVQLAVECNFNDATQITLSDTGTHNFNGISVGTNGNYKITFLDDSVLSLTLQRGWVYYFKIKRMWATGAAGTVQIVGFNERI